jgi:hypothetical protein
MQILVSRLQNGLLAIATDGGPGLIGGGYPIDDSQPQGRFFASDEELAQQGGAYMLEQLRLEDQRDQKRREELARERADMVRFRRDAGNARVGGAYLGNRPVERLDDGVALPPGFRGSEDVERDKPPADSADALPGIGD